MMRRAFSVASAAAARRLRVTNVVAVGESRDVISDTHVRLWSALSAQMTAAQIPSSRTLDWKSPLSRPQQRTMFIQTQSTPNADALMFLPGRDVMPGGVGSADFPNLRSAGGSPLARRLLGVDGVCGVFFGAHFITVTKDESVEWAVIRPEVFEVVMDFFLDENNEVLSSDGDSGWSSDTAISEDDTEVVAMIKELLETRVKPAVAEDGGSILFRGFHVDEGIVDLELQGACSSCSSSSVTLKSGVENMLRHYIPEVKEVREVFGEHASELRKASNEQLDKVEQHLKDSGILRS